MTEVHVAGKRIPVHKFVLARCPPLDVMFKSSFAEAKLDVVPLPMEESAVCALFFIVIIATF